MPKTMENVLMVTFIVSNAMEVLAKRVRMHIYLRDSVLNQ